jgi:hypothetical protein
MGGNTSTQTVEAERTPEQVENQPAQQLPQPQTKKPRFSITIVGSIPL